MVLAQDKREAEFDLLLHLLVCVSYLHSGLGVQKIASAIKALSTSQLVLFHIHSSVQKYKCFSDGFTLLIYTRGADKSFARPGRKQTTATEDFDIHMSNL